MKSGDTEYYSATEAARFLGKPRSTVHFLIQERWKGKCMEIPYGAKIMYLIPRALVEAYKKEKGLGFVHRK